MSECPKCSSDIGFLLLFEKGWCMYHVGEKKGYVKKKFIESLLFPGDIIDEVYKCPRCEKVLFANSEDALTFLTLSEKTSSIMPG